MFYFLLPFLITALLLLILGLIRPTIIKKILGFRISRLKIALIFGIMTIGFFVLTYATTPELKSLLKFNNGKNIQTIEGESQNLADETKEEPTTSPSPASQTNKPIRSNIINNSVPADATAQCNDGTYSFSQNHQGTCSYHGGVKNWLE